MRSKELEAVRLRVLSLFHSDEPAKTIALNFRVSPKSLHKWWCERFGEDAVSVRWKAALRKKNIDSGFILGDSKLCPRCGKSTSDFYPSSRDPHRPRSWCRSCEIAHSVAHREAETPSERVSRLTLQQGRNREYYREHAEDLRSYARGYREKNRSTTNAKQRAYYIANPHKLLFQLARRRAKKFGVPFRVTSDDIRAAIPLDNLCPVTLSGFVRGVSRVGPRSMTLDRILPERGYVPGNIAVISHQANTMKSNCVDPEVFRRVAAYLEGSLRVSLGNSGLIPPKHMLKSARTRAKRDALPCNLTRASIEEIIPSDGRCPITGRVLRLGSGKVQLDSMSLDRIVSHLGYVRGNIAVISNFANTVKNNCSDPQIFRRLADYVETALLKAESI